jgi:hypothetical protein
VAANLRLALLAALSLVAVAIVSAGDPRVHISPSFTVGQALRYRISTLAVTEGSTTSPVVDPNAGSKQRQTVNLVVLFNVLGVQPPSPATPAKIRFQVSYEQARSHTESDTFSPDPSAADDQYSRLEGRSTEFTLAPGQDSSSPAASTNPSAPSASADSSSVGASAFTWLTGLALPPSLAQKGIAMGEKWTSEHPLDGLPFNDVMWRAQSTYVRNEPCAVSTFSALPSAPVSGGAICAVILTRFEISRRDGEHSDATPDDYRRHGLRTTGKLSASGQTLDSISIATGLLVSETQSSTQNADYEIRGSSHTSTIHHVGKVETQSEIALVPFEAPAS